MCCKAVGWTVEWAGPDLCPLCLQCTFRLTLAWGFCVPPQLLQGSEKEEAREIEFIWSDEEMAKGAWRYTLGPGTAHHMTFGQRSRTCFHKFRPMDLRQTGSCLPVLPLKPGWAEHCIGGCEQEKVTSAVRWDDKRHLFQQRSLPSLDLDLPPAGPGLYSLHGCQAWERKDWELRLAPRGRCRSEGFHIAK